MAGLGIEPEEQSPEERVGGHGGDGRIVPSWTSGTVAIVAFAKSLA